MTTFSEKPILLAGSKRASGTTAGNDKQAPESKKTKGNTNNNNNNNNINHPYSIVPLKPRPHCAIATGNSTTCVLYMAIAEPPAFGVALQRLAQRAPADVHQHCFQRDGTRHVSLWQGCLTLSQIQQLSLRATGNKKKMQPLRLDVAGWKPWKAGLYLALTRSSQQQLHALVDRLVGLPTGKRSCDHLSLYRRRDYKGTTNTYAAFATLRRDTAHWDDWGHVMGVSLRIKAMGTPYDECWVLADAPWTTLNPGNTINLYDDSDSHNEEGA